MIKKLSLKGLAEFMTATPSHQRKILRAYKYPAEDEARAKILYYREARDRIAAFHVSKHDCNWLHEEASRLDSLAAYCEGQRRTRLLNNAKGIRLYMRYFASRRFEVLNEFLQDIQFGDVYISVYPDLHVKERGLEKIIKLEFAKNAPDSKIIKIICQCMFEAAHAAGLSLSSSSVLYFDVPRGKAYQGARMGARMGADVEATCRNISAIWDAI